VKCDCLIRAGVTEVDLLLGFADFFFWQNQVSALTHQYDVHFASAKRLFRDLSKFKHCAQTPVCKFKY